MKRLVAVSRLIYVCQRQRLTLMLSTPHHAPLCTSICLNDGTSEHTSGCFRLAAAPTRFYSSDIPRKNFFGNLIEKIKEEFERNKELQENKRELDKRLRELNDSEALKDARRKFELVEKETMKSTEVIQAKLREAKETMSKIIAEIQKTEAGRKMSAAAEEALKQARAAAETIEKAAEQIGDTQVYQTVSASMKVVKDEIDNIADVRMYSRPEQLKMRTHSYSTGSFTDRIVEANPDASEVQLHKESRWNTAWKEFSEKNVYFNKFLDWKIRYDESENVAVRLMRGVTDRIVSLFTTTNEVAEVLTEIAKVDPTFEKTEWLRFCERDVIPNILEAFIREDLEVLQDWCHERAFNQLSAIIKEYKKIGFTKKDSRVIDISKAEMVSGKMMEQGPVIIITFQAFMLNVVKNQEGKVVKGDPSNPIRVHHVWVMCRDMEEYNPAIAWKLLEAHMQEAPLSI